MEAADDVDGLGRERGVTAVRAAAVGVEQADAELLFDLTELVPGSAVGNAQTGRPGGERAILVNGFEQGDTPGGEGDAAVALEPDLGVDVDWCRVSAHSVMRTLA